MLFDDMNEDDFPEEAVAAELNKAEALLPPRESDFLIGHSGIEKLLKTRVDDNNMPHALIFNGPKGIGKSTMAFRLARYLLKNGQGVSQDSLFGGEAIPANNGDRLTINRDDPIFSQVASAGHPDLLTLELSVDPKTQKVKKDINVESARKVAPFLRMTSSNGGWRVVIVDDADRLNRNAQNALLKILEEPPKNALLILVTHRLGALIPTIKSRCHLMNFNDLDAHEFESLLKSELDEELSPQESKILSLLSGNRIGEIRTLLDNNAIYLIDSLIQIFDQWPNYDFMAIHKFSDRLIGNKQDIHFQFIAKSFSALLQKIILAKAKGEMLEAPFASNNIENFKSQHDLEYFLNLYEVITEHFKEATISSLDKKIAVINAFHILK